MSETKSKFSLDARNMLFILLAVTVIFIPFLLHDNQYMSQLEMKTLGLMVSFLIILLSEALPTVVACLLYCALIPLLGITRILPLAFYGFSQPILYFVLISFAVALAITKVPLAKRVLRLLLVKFGKNVNMVLFALMACCFLMSTFVSDIPTAVIFISIALSFLDLIENEEKKKSVGKAFMIGIPLASMLGGMTTPAGSSLNLVGLAQLEKLTGQTVTFVEWVCMALPFTVLAGLFAWWIIIMVYKPANISQEELKSIVDSIDVPKKFSADEIKVMIIVLCMFVLWVASSWISEINIILVTLVGGSLFFFPGIKVIDVQSYLKEISWKVVFLLGTMFSISNLLIENGASETLAKIMPTINMNVSLLIAFMCLLTFILVLILPNAPSVLPILAIAVVSLAAKSGVDSKFMIMAATLAIGNTYLLPLDAIMLMSFGKGYYTFKELPKSTAFVQLFALIFLSLWLPIIGHLLGWI